MAHCANSTSRVIARQKLKLDVEFPDILVFRLRGSLINKAVVGKWGLRVGRVELDLKRAPGS